MEAAEKEKKESERLARQVAADIGDGGKGVFVDVRKLAAEEFLTQKGHCGDRGVTLCISLAAN